MLNNDIVIERIEHEKIIRSGSLDLAGLKICELSPQLAELKWLYSLNLSHNALTDISVVAKLSNLKKLDLSYNSLSQIEGLADLEELNNLDLSYNKISNVDCLVKLMKLTWLNLRSNLVENINSLSGLNSLEHLDIRGNKLKIIKFYNHAQLIYLDASYNQLADVSIQYLPSLKTLSLPNNQISQIELKSIPQLIILDLANNQLQSIAKCVNLDNLKILLLPNNSIWEIPNMEIFPNLEQISLRLNRIEVLDNSLSGCRNLELLDLSANNIKELKNIELLPKLRKLLLHTNKITDIRALLPFYQRKTIDITLDYNPLTSPPIEIVKAGVEAIEHYYQELDAGYQNIYEAKLLIIGEGGAGKTSLMRKLLDIDAALPTEDEVTHGIDIKALKFLLSNGEEFKINIWDFGGQEIYKLTHLFFLTKQSLYVVVDDSRKDARPIYEDGLYYWLETAKMFAGNSPLLIVQNEKGDSVKNIDMSEAQKIYSRVLDKKETNLATGRGVKDIIATIQHYIQMLPHIGARIPKSWWAIRLELERMKYKRIHYIGLYQYLEICKKYGIHDRQKALALSQYAHDLGVFLHFQGHSLLSKTIILDNEWLTRAVYAILDSDAISRKKGRPLRIDLESVWDCSEYQGMYSDLLALMEEFELCYAIEDSHQHYLIPQMLPYADGANCERFAQLTVQLRYSGVVADGLLARYIVRIHDYIKDDNQVWKNRVLLEYRSETHAEIEYQKRDKTIWIRLWGKHCRDFMIILLEHWDSLHRRYENIQFKKLLPCICSQCQINPNRYYFDYEIVKSAEAKQVLGLQCQQSFEMVGIQQLLDNVFFQEKNQFVHPAAHHILFLSASPDSERRIRVDKEERALKDAYERSHFREKWNVITKPAITPQYLEKALFMYPSPNVVHLAAHASLDEMAMEYDEIRGSNVSIAELETLVKECIDFKKEQGYERLDCIILNACDSAATAKTISGLGIYAIGMRGAIEDNRAIEFTQLFYTQLFAGRTYYQSFCSAVKLLRYQNEIPRLYKNGDDITPE